MKKTLCTLILLALPVAAGCSRGAGTEPTGTIAGASQPATASSATPSPTADAMSKPPAATAASSVPTAKVTATSKPEASRKPTAAAAASAAPTLKPSSSAVLAPAEAKQVIEAKARQTMAALQTKDWSALTDLIHPGKGLRLSPYCYVDVRKDVVISKEQLVTATTDTHPREWGQYDGSGEPILLTFGAFYDKILYNHDYAKPEKTGYNESWGKGTMINNMRETYPESILVEYYFSGFEPANGGMDWASLTLVFERQGNDWCLSGLVRNQWTV